MRVPVRGSRRPPCRAHACRRTTARSRGERRHDATSYCGMFGCVWTLKHRRVPNEHPRATRGSLARAERLFQCDEHIRHVLEEAAELDVGVGLLGDENAVDDGEAEAGDPADDLAAGVAVEGEAELLAQAA